MSIIWNFGNSGMGLSGVKQPKQDLTCQGFDLNRYHLAKNPLLDDNKETSAKIKKNKRASFIMYLAPATYAFTTAGLREQNKIVNVCPDASPECITTCLNISGRTEIEMATARKNFGQKKKFKFDELGNVLKSRIRKTALYVCFPEFFYKKLARDIKKIADKYTKQSGGATLLFRLNGTSDLPLVENLQSRGYLNDIPKNAVFYDYTKDPLKVGSWKLPSGHRYIVTFSRSETNTPMALKKLEQGQVVAVVFRDKLPKKWYGYKILDGDAADDIMVDLAEGSYKGMKFNWGKGKGVVLGLSAKGTLKKFQSKKGAKGFVIDCDSLEDCRIGL